MVQSGSKSEDALVTSLRSQLAQCKSQLSESRSKTRLYADRSRQLGFARAVSEKQLTELVRCLLELEAKLKREKVEITSALAKRDEIIARQKAEIALLQQNRVPESTTSTSNQPTTSPILLTIDRLLEQTLPLCGDMEDGEKHDSGRESDDDALSLKAVESPRNKDSEDVAVDSSDSANHSESESPPSPSPPPPPPPVDDCCYEKFLEATGLSQKAILTPNRQFQLAVNSHRAVVKPKDVKHKDKDRHKAASTQQMSLHFGSLKENKRYWMEPYV